jgi:dynein heavy chain
MPKFLAHDLPLFKGITEDLFQDVVMYPTAYGQLSTHITESIKACNLQDIEPFVDKVY